MRITISIKNGRTGNIATHNATAADLARALDSSYMRISTGATIENTNISWHEVDGRYLIRAGAWWFYTPGVGPYYFAIKDGTREENTTILESSRKAYALALIKDFKEHHPVPNQAIEDITNAVTKAIHTVAVQQEIAPVAESALEVRLREMESRLAVQQAAAVPPAPPVLPPRQPMAAPANRYLELMVMFLAVMLFTLLAERYCCGFRHDTAVAAVQPKQPEFDPYTLYERLESRFSARYANTHTDDSPPPPSPPPVVVSEGYGWTTIICTGLVILFTMSTCSAAMDRAPRLPKIEYFDGELAWAPDGDFY